LISTKASFQWIGINIMKLLTIIRKENWYIVIAMDYLTKWLIAKALKEATAKAVSSFVYRRIIHEHGYLEILQNDQETHFVNRVI